MTSGLETILPVIAARLGPPQGAPVPLEGGITNRNYRVRFGGRDYVVRVCGKATGPLGINRSTECIATERAAALGIGPPVAMRLEADDVLVVGFLPGPTADAARVREPRHLREIARGLRAFHASPPLPTAFDVYALVREQAALGDPPPGYADLLALADRVRAALAGHPEHAPVPCHNDLLPANFLVGGERVFLLDWEYAGMNDRYFDLGNLAVNNALSEDDVALLLRAYWDEEPAPRRLAAVHLMRFMSDFREAMWGVAQGALSELDFDYGAYAREHFERLEHTAADPRFEEWMTVAATA